MKRRKQPLYLVRFFFALRNAINFMACYIFFSIFFFKPTYKGWNRLFEISIYTCFACFVVIRFKDFRHNLFTQNKFKNDHTCLIRSKIYIHIITDRFYSILFIVEYEETEKKISFACSIPFMAIKYTATEECRHLDSYPMIYFFFSQQVSLLHMPAKPIWIWSDK